ncbi:GntR family transcriptional regulator [Ornithinimicrobium pekingense]|uniref:GntR family transcriptional regulator n=1 Tax=Ornithinimicrobium pekingense TaxID=384677 RepID=A0ABQ2FD67_9MICO|nr:GntR family transcriptional regulator [Ornithinimicrobium pekingense]GGK83017.1 GntR family transcriptional regulator [Ornithinimicrobium pekingense]
MLIRIDTRATEPIYTQIAREVRRALAVGELSGGDRLPAARELARSLDVNMHTVLRAYGDLRDEGVIELRRGRGAVVVDVPAPPDEVSTAVRDLVALARRHDIPLSDLHHALDALDGEGDP